MSFSLTSLWDHLDQTRILRGAILTHLLFTPPGTNRFTLNYPPPNHLSTLNQEEIQRQGFTQKQDVYRMHKTLVNNEW